eukprot:CAMPEP_0204271588 /NCGR_PEP_ID=MMETSP0468-20130131/20383_1 /ASSEMBLY_ACC=CAM_ASM_000383 /TAXON_ID=2969 /ORGANISM="Oxyrrhis marina" /LENGTH=294 /DNA_ID=CAMNT_0051247293 /DNA_START=51 /DNA_END=935 /DNA_ORIENTATION=-
MRIAAPLLWAAAVANPLVGRLEGLFVESCEQADPEAHNCYKSATGIRTVVQEKKLCSPIQVQDFPRDMGHIDQALDNLASANGQFASHQGQPFIGLQWVYLAMNQTFDEFPKAEVGHLGTHAFVLIHDLENGDTAICDAWQRTHQCRCSQFPKVTDFDPSLQPGPGYENMAYSDWFQSLRDQLKGIVQLGEHHELSRSKWESFDRLFLKNTEKIMIVRRRTQQRSALLRHLASTLSPARAPTDNHSALLTVDRSQSRTGLCAQQDLDVVPAATGWKTFKTMHCIQPKSDLDTLL